MYIYIYVPALSSRGPHPRVGRGGPPPPPRWILGALVGGRVFLKVFKVFKVFVGFLSSFLLVFVRFSMFFKFLSGFHTLPNILQGQVITAPHTDQTTRSRAVHLSQDANPSLAVQASEMHKSAVQCTKYAETGTMSFNQWYVLSQNHKVTSHKGPKPTREPKTHRGGGTPSYTGGRGTARAESWNIYIYIHIIYIYIYI